MGLRIISVDLAKQVPPDGDSDHALIYQLREYGRTNGSGKMDLDCSVPKWLLNVAADRIEELKNGITAE